MAPEMRRPVLDRHELVTVVTNLLAIAKVAMPRDLFAMDPRVLAAQEMLATLQEGTTWSRVPSVPKAPEEVPFIGVADPSDPRTGQVLAALDAAAARPQWDITEGLDRFMDEPDAPAARSEAIVMILRDWLIAHGYLEPGPAKDDAH